MITGFVILGLFVLAFIVTSCAWIKVRIDYINERDRCKAEHCAISYKALKRKRADKILVCIRNACLIGIIITAIAIAAINGRNNDISADTTEPTIIETEPVVGEDEVVEPSVPETAPIKPTYTKPSCPVVAITIDDPINSSTIVKPTIDPYELELLALVIYQEVGGRENCDNCRRYVADVVLNRVADPRYPDTIEEVLTQPHQYGLLWKTGINWPPRRAWEGEKPALEKAYRIAREILMGIHSDIYGEGYVYQAGFKQGDEGFWCCGNYFARGEW